MNDDELDRRLAGVRERTTLRTAADALHELGGLAAAVAHAESAGPAERRTPAPPPARGMWALGLTAAAVTLTAGTTVTAFFLGVPPFQSVPSGTVRTAQSIPLDYETSNSVEIRCRMFLEFERAGSADVEAVDVAIRSRDWSGFGQSLYDAQADLPDAPTDSLNPQDPVVNAATDAVYVFAATVLPGLGRFGEDRDGPTLSGIATTCVPGA